MRRLEPFVAAMLAVACGDGGDVRPDAAVAVDAAAASDAAAPVADAGSPDANLAPQSLRDTGLYADFDAQLVASDVLEYSPAHELWSDGASKRRWVYLPPGETIDTADLDHWRYPVGTRLWKEFTRDGTRVETRLLLKIGPSDGDWFMMAYAWNAAQTEADAVPLGVVDALGTGHDIPDTSRCESCHAAVADAALGFTAIQLAHEGDGVTLAQLVVDERLSAPPAELPALPGDATAVAALGYLHANCGTCHSDASELGEVLGLRLWLTVDALAAVEQTPTYLTAVGAEPQLSAGGATALIEPGDAAASAIYVRMTSRTPIGMPPVGSELVDTTGAAAVAAWIDAL